MEPKGCSVKTILLLLASVALFLGAGSVTKLNYPVAPKSDQVDDYHGVKVADPYRGLENADAPATEKWVTEENELTFGYLAKLPGREAIKKQLTDLWNYEKFGGFEKAGNHYFYFHNSGLQNQSVVYVTDSLTGTPRVLLDPNTYRKDGTTALDGESVSWNGKLFGYAVAQAGSDWAEWRVRDVATGKDLSDLIQWTKGSIISWAEDDRGFYYSRYAEPPAAKMLTVAALDEKVYFHKLGDPQTADKLIYERPDHPNWGIDPLVMEGSRYLLLYIYTGVPGKNLLAYQDLRAANSKTVMLIPSADFSYGPIAVVGSTLYLQTSDGAPRGRVIAMNMEHPERTNWKEIVPERPETLDGVQMADGKLLLSYMKDAHSAARLVSLDGKTSEDIVMPGIGTAAWSGARLQDKEMFYSFDGFTIAPSIYRLDLETGKSAVIRQSKVAVDLSQYETKQVFYASKDGTRIPMFLSSKKGLKLDGQNPTLLYAYGGFDVAETPGFRPRIVEWMQMGGVYASGGYPRRIGIWRGVAPGGDARQEAECVRRFHRGGRMADREQIYVDAETGDLWREQWRAADRRGAESAAGSVRRGHAGGGRDGHAAVPELRVRDAVGRRVRIVGESRRFQGAARVFAAAQHSQGRAVSADADHHVRSRRSRDAGAQLKVRGHVAAGAGGSGAHINSDRDARGARSREADHQADRRVG